MKREEKELRFQKLYVLQIHTLFVLIRLEKNDFQTISKKELEVFHDFLIEQLHLLPPNT